MCGSFLLCGACLGLLLVAPACAGASGQQVIQRGAFGKPGAVLDETGQWTTPLLVASDSDVDIYIPDVTSPDWLEKNYRAYEDRGLYTLSMFTYYRTPKACRQNQIAWGLGDQAHLDACMTIGYRVRKARIDPQQKSATLLTAAMVDQNGGIDPGSLRTENRFSFWNQLDSNTRAALEKADTLVAEQMRIYDKRMQSMH